jgi:hypothetical protein
MTGTLERSGGCRESFLLGEKRLAKSNSMGYM